MKKTLSFKWIAIATLCVIMASVLPHHHHHGEACMAIERCEMDHTDNDRHTQHDDDGSTCLEDIDYRAAQQLQVPSAIQFAFSALHASSPMTGQCGEGIRIGYGNGEDKRFHPFNDGMMAMGLRAPPALV